MAKKKSKDELVSLGKDLVSQIKKKKNPFIDIPVRGLSNVNYNKKKKTLELGNKISKRFFFHLGQAKRFF